MTFLEENCIFEVLTNHILLESYPFVCGDNDMDEFFRKEAIAYTQYKMGKTYCFKMREDVKQIVACFTVSNDSIRIYDLPNSRKNAMWGITHREKMLTRYPGVRPPKDENERAERKINPRKLYTRLMFCDLLDEE